MKILVALLGSLTASACSEAPRNQGEAASNALGAMVNRADDAPGNMASAPVRVSGSGEVPPNAPVQQGAGNVADSSVTNAAGPR